MTLKPIAAVMTAFIIALLLAAFPGLAFAHAELERTVPEANARLDAGPAAIEIYFNEAIEAKIGSLKVLDSSSRTITKGDPVSGADRRSLKIDLPTLAEGTYTVSYAVVSADGHPVSGSDVFVVGNPTEAVDASTFDPHKQAGHDSHSDHEFATQLGGKQFLIYALRFIYYTAILLGSGIMLWSLLHRDSTAFAAVRRKWELPAMRFLLIAVLLYVFIHASEILEGYPASDYLTLFTSTTIGRTWLALLALSVAGFGVLKLGGVLRALWALLLLGVESYSGHAIVFEPASVSLLLDFVHLAASAVWVGGLGLLLICWLADRKEAGRFAAIFSRIALIALIVLVLSGIALTLLFMPSLEYLSYTAWGTLLFIKTGLVLLVMIVGAFLRRRVRRGDLPNFTLLRVDLGLMVCIMIIVGIFTYVSPLPANKAVYFHKMGAEMHVTLRITPNKPGMDNKLKLNIWLPEQKGTPKKVVLRLKSKDKADLGAIDVPVQPIEDNEKIAFEGYDRADYFVEGPYIPFAGNWIAEIRVMDKDDNELVERYEFRNY